MIRQATLSQSRDLKKSYDRAVWRPTGVKAIAVCCGLIQKLLPPTHPSLPFAAITRSRGASKSIEISSNSFAFLQAHIPRAFAQDRKPERAPGSLSSGRPWSG
jgi:hypothetical protein